MEVATNRNTIISVHMIPFLKIHIYKISTLVPPVHVLSLAQKHCILLQFYQILVFIKLNQQSHFLVFKVYER